MCGRGSYPAGALGATMDLWFEMKLLEQTNLTRDGAWLDLVRTKQERLEKTQQTSETSISIFSTVTTNNRKPQRVRQMPKPSEIREIALSNTRFLSPPTVPPVGGAKAIE